MPIARRGAACAVVFNPTTDCEEVVVAGGWDGVIYTPRVDTYSLCSKTWRTLSRPMPEELGFSAAVQYQDSFVVVGGNQGLNFTSSIFKYEVVSHEWTRMPGQLAQAKSSVAATLVPRSAFPECDEEEEW